MDGQEKLKCLPLRCSPEADESLTGYVLRLALRNYETSPGPLAAAAGIQKLPALFPTTDQIDRLAILVGHPPETFERMASRRITSSTRRKKIHLRGVVLPRDWLTVRRRACPRCLTQSPYHRLVWDIVHVRVCGVHSCALVTSCRKCGRRLDWGGADLRRCGCGHDISGQPSPPCDPAAAAAALWIGGTILHDGSPPPALLKGVNPVEGTTALTLLEAAFHGCLAKDVANPLAPLGSNGQAFAFQSFDGDVDRLRGACDVVLDKAPGVAFRRSKAAVSQLASLCAATPGLKPAADMLQAYSGIPTPIRFDHDGR